MTADTIPSNPRSEPVTNKFSKEEFENANAEPTPTLRRSSRICQQAGEWWKENGHFAQALSAQTIPTSYRVAVSLENIDFWKSGID